MSFLINRNYFIELSSSLAFNHGLYDFHFQGDFYCRFELRKRRLCRVFINLDIFSVFYKEILNPNCTILVSFWCFTKQYTRKKISGILWFWERINFAFLSKCVIQTHTPVHKHVYLNSCSTHVYTHLHEDYTRLRLQLCVKDTWSILNEHKALYVDKIQLYVLA